MPDDTADQKRGEEDELIVAVFDTKTVALRTIEELRSAKFVDLWLGVVSGETPSGHTTIAPESRDGEQPLLRATLVAHGASEALARRFDAILPPGTAIMALPAGDNFERAIEIIQVTGGHVEGFC